MTVLRRILLCSCLGALACGGRASAPRPTTAPDLGAGRAPGSGAVADGGGAPGPVSVADGGGDPGPVSWGGSCDDGGAAPPTPTGAWRNVTANLAGLSSMCGNLSMLAAKPDADLLLAGIASQGLWTSRDGGGSWTQIAGADVIQNVPARIVWDPQRSGTYWETGIYGNHGVYRTSDDGKSFTQLAQAFHTDTVGVDFTDPARQTLLAGGHERPWLWKTSDGGMSWSDIGSSLPAGSGFSSFAVVIDKSTFVVGTWSWTQSDTPGIFRSSDGGATWKRVSDAVPVPQGAPLVTASGDIYFTVTGGGLVRSGDGGATFATIAPAGTLQTTPLIELPDGRLVGVGGQALVVSPDCGTSWSPITTALPFTPGAIAYSPYQKAFFVTHNDCGNAVLGDAVMRYDFDYRQ